MDLEITIVHMQKMLELNAGNNIIVSNNIYATNSAYKGTLTIEFVITIVMIQGRSWWSGRTGFWQWY